MCQYVCVFATVRNSIKKQKRKHVRRVEQEFCFVDLEETEFQCNIGLINKDSTSYQQRIKKQDRRLNSKYKIT